MANKNCQACADLQEYAPEFVLNGVTDNVCASLKNNTGFNPSNNRNDCTDLDDANDCLIGNMEEEVDAYDVCDWKEFMKKFIPNAWTVLKAIICAICGIWTKIKALQDAMTNWQKLIDALNCKINFILGGKSYDFTEDDFEFGEYVSKRSGKDSVEWNLRVRGSTYRIHGSVRIALESGGSTTKWGTIGKATVNGINTDSGNWTVAILKIKKSEYPEISGLYACTGMTTNNGCAMISVVSYNGDAENPDDRKMPDQWGSGTRTVKSGEIWVRIAMTNSVTWGSQSSSQKYWEGTFNATGMANINQSGLKC